MSIRVGKFIYVDGKKMLYSDYKKKCDTCDRYEFVQHNISQESGFYCRDALECSCKDLGYVKWIPKKVKTHREKLEDAKRKKCKDCPIYKIAVEYMELKK
jgi:hypothetical protein